MGFADLHGKARVDPSKPDGFAECDECGEWYNRTQLGPQMEYSGTRLFWTGFLVCPTCLSEPQPQFLNPILPGDPKPIIQPRPARLTSTFIAPGFTLFELVPVLSDPAAVLASIAAATGIATPALATAPAQAQIALNAPMKAQQILGANGLRTWLLIYNPGSNPIVVSTGQAAFSGDPKAILLGAGQAMFALAPIPTGALTVIGYFAGAPLFVFESPAAGLMPPIPVIFP